MVSLRVKGSNSGAPKGFFYGFIITGCTGPKERAQALSLSRSIQLLFCPTDPPTPHSPPILGNAIRHLPVASPLACSVYRPAPSHPLSRPSSPSRGHRCSQSITDKHRVRTLHASLLFTLGNTKAGRCRKPMLEATDPSASTCTATGTEMGKGDRWGEVGPDRGEGACTCVTEV